jgi:type I restriction enzyme R subunit
MPSQAHGESEARTRSKRIDPQLEARGWEIAPFDPKVRLKSYTRHAVTEYPTGNGPADYALFVDGQVLGIVEAKKLTLGPPGLL